jgi:hypothetical protein
MSIVVPYSLHITEDTPMVRLEVKIAECLKESNVDWVLVWLPFVLLDLCWGKSIAGPRLRGRGHSL